jgi:hypothetical protein
MTAEKVARASGANKPWTSKEVALLRDNAARGARECSNLLGRSLPSVRCTAHRHRISLRRPGSRRGSVLGQPRGVSLRSGLREDLVGPKVAAAMAARMALDREAELCPYCAARPITVPTTGLCRTCHLHALAQAHREQLAEIEAQRALWQSRQELKRARDGAGDRAGGSLDEG